MEGTENTQSGGRYSKEEIQMSKLTHAAGRKVFSGVIDLALGQVKKNPEQAFFEYCRYRSEIYGRV